MTDSHGDRSAAMVAKAATVVTDELDATRKFARAAYDVELVRIDDADARRQSEEAATALRLNWLERRVAELESLR